MAGIASVVLETSPLISDAVPILHSLRERLALDAALAVWDRGGVLCLQPGAAPSIVRRAPDECIAVTTVLLAGRPDAEIDALSHIAHETVIAPGADFPDELAGRLEHVRAGGLIGDFRAGNGGVCSLVAPVVDAAGSVVAALAVQAPRERWQVHKQEFIRGLRGAALRLAPTATG